MKLLKRFSEIRLLLVSKWELKEQPRNLLLKTAIFTTILLSLTQNLFAFQSEGETTTIEGTVYDTEGVPLPGVTVLEKNTTNGVQTDFDGNYSMDVNSNQAILIFSYVGMKSQEIVV